jgi:uncharacterized delta-60 repeat protein
VRRLFLAVIVIGCGARSDLSGVPLIDAGGDVQPPEAFVLSVSPTSFTITQGGSPITLAVHIERHGPFNDEVDVAIPSLPTGWSATSAVLAPSVSDATLLLTAALQSTQGTAQPIIVRASTVSAGQKTAALSAFVRGCPGCLDTTFGTNGRTTVSNYPWYLAVDSSNRIILGTEPPTVDSLTIGILVRFDANGNADPSFGVNGEADTPFALGWSALSLDVDDRLLVGGFVGDFLPNTPEHGAVIRFTANGLLDTTFGNGGSMTVSNTPTTFGPIAPLPDGSFISAGQTWSGTNKQVGVMWLPKVLPSGALDTTFGKIGISVDPWQIGAGFANGVVRIADNRFVVGGSAFADANDSHFALARFSDDGSPDATFGTNGQLVSDVSGDARAILLTPSDHYFMCGATDAASQFAMFAPDGTLDTSFGVNGVVTTNPIQTDDTNARNCAVQTDGKLLALGSSDEFRSYLLRMNPDGTFDDAFATNGVVTFAFDTYTFAGPVLQADGRILVAGFSSSMNSPPQSFLLRYWN